MISSPSFLTFTGADDATSIEQMIELAEQYPVEFGILFSPQRQGQGRYPSFRFVRQVMEQSHRLRLSAHLCGEYSREVLSNGKSGLEGMLLSFQRVQINTLSEMLPTQEIGLWAASVHEGLTPIVQCRGAFPEDAHVAWLYDTSAGHGLSPQAWPEPPSSDTLRGYAGGLRAANVAAAIEAIASSTDKYWLDMESGVRDERDRFDIEACRQVCEQVWGGPHEVAVPTAHASCHRDSLPG